MPPYGFLLCLFLCPYAPPIPPMYLPMASMSLPMALLCFPPMSPLPPPHAFLCPLCPFSCTFQCPHSPSISSCPYALSCFPFMPLSPWMSPPIHPMLNYAQHTYPMLFLCPHVHFYNPYAPPINPFMLHVSCTPCVLLCLLHLLHHVPTYSLYPLLYLPEAPLITLLPVLCTIWPCATLSPLCLHLYAHCFSYVPPYAMMPILYPPCFLLGSFL